MYLCVLPPPQGLVDIGDLAELPDKFTLLFCENFAVDPIFLVQIKNQELIAVVIVLPEFRLILGCTFFPVIHVEVTDEYVVRKFFEMLD